MKTSELIRLLQINMEEVGDVEVTIEFSAIKEERGDDTIYLAVDDVTDHCYCRNADGSECVILAYE